eukprot:CAMPEP_0194782508 /NCGR_PEP_ID=MMETSP0323_2-20130528/78727_1 /TAXON_ID=2866 ORGANISM="Crypthecodinium cohnii, Strain Seligo" /NCGR_SAMPLE_ID=MMETSP0323_2 /ASSEMBLY_ACC=CAM_ASM_000346 /LENGTH=95 /DNA_ID=CAMNT_0039721325 /DNA_START=19 /DNA_END=306 /DNA_ORIENTATION=+
MEGMLFHLMQAKQACLPEEWQNACISCGPSMLLTDWLSMRLSRPNETMSIDKSGCIGITGIHQNGVSGEGRARSGKGKTIWPERIHWNNAGSVSE